MFKAVYQAYSQLKAFYDPAMEGSPYDKKKTGVAVRPRAGYRYPLSRLSKNFIVR